jgi:hypothetical protein
MLFKRSASVEVKFKGSEKRIKIENLRFTFSCAKTFTPTANICDLKIYNLSKYTRDQFHELGDEITLNTGYESREGEQVLFVANTRRVHHNNALPEIITEIEALDADLFFLLKPVKGSFSSGVSALTVLKDIASQMGVNKITVPQGTPDLIYNNGKSFSGPAEREITSIARYLNLEWSVQNKEILFSKVGQNVEAPPIQLNAETGLIYFPELLRDLSIPFDFKTEEKRIGWRVRSILNPKIRPKSQVNLYSEKIKNLNGTYTVQNVKHVGDTHGNQWETIAEMIRV